MKRVCTHCGGSVTGYRKTCSEACRVQRYRAGGLEGNRSQKEAGLWWQHRSAGDARSVMIGGQLQVLDPVALAGQGVRLAEHRGAEWTEWVAL